MNSHRIWAFVLSIAAQLPQASPERERVWLESGPRETCVDVLFVGDGYTAKELTRVGKYWKDVDRCSKRLFQEAPFASYKARFNVRALLLESKQGGCDAEAASDAVDTALDSRFDTKEGRLLVFRNTDRLKTLVERSGPTDIVFVMVNTERYGGAGTSLQELDGGERTLPAPTFAALDTRAFLIALHELGHSYARLGDEYDDREAVSVYPLPNEGDLSPANVSLEAAFGHDSFQQLKATVKWRHFLGLPGAEKERWCHEGGYFREHGVYRPWRKCRMRNNDDAFCPICSEEIAKSILVTCGSTWDDAAWHVDHPLTEWR